jgi:hypothetical protein
LGTSAISGWTGVTNLDSVWHLFGDFRDMNHVNFLEFVPTTSRESYREAATSTAAKKAMDGDSELHRLPAHGAILSSFNPLILAVLFMGRKTWLGLKD